MRLVRLRKTHYGNPTKGHAKSSYDAYLNTVRGWMEMFLVAAMVAPGPSGKDDVEKVTKTLKALALLVVATSSFFACSPIAEAPFGGRRPGDDARFAATPAPPRLAAATRANIDDVARGVANLTDDTIMGRRGVRLIEVSEIPYLRASPVGALFLAGAPARALARGEPAASCPAATEAVGAPDRPEAARRALEACFDQLEARGADAACGCRIEAVDSILLDRREAFAFAPAVSALMIGAPGAARSSSLLVAEALPPLDGAERVLLRDAAGEVGRLVLDGPDAALVLTGEPDRLFTGAREPFGFRRGRIAERLRLADAGGRRLDVLIGVEERDVFRE